MHTWGVSGNKYERQQHYTTQQRYTTQYQGFTIKAHTFSSFFAGKQVLNSDAHGKILVLIVSLMFFPSPSIERGADKMMSGSVVRHLLSDSYEDVAKIVTIIYNQEVGGAVFDAFDCGKAVWGHKEIRVQLLWENVSQEAQSGVIIRYQQDDFQTGRRLACVQFLNLRQGPPPLEKDHEFLSTFPNQL
jgi:hypothetical protein